MSREKGRMIKKVERLRLEDFTENGGEDVPTGAKTPALASPPVAHREMLPGSTESKEKAGNAKEGRKDHAT